MTVFEKIEEQQSTCKNTPAFCVGEQLKDICRTDPRNAEIVLQDLKNASMSIVEAEKKIAAHAKKHTQGCVGFVSPADSDRILREFYGLPLLDETPESAPRKAVVLDFNSFL